MKTFKWPIVTAVVSSIGTFLHSLINKEPITTSSLSNAFFIVLLLFLIIGIALRIISSGLFDNFRHSLKNASRFKKKSEPREFIPLSVTGDARRSFWLKTGDILLILSLDFLLFYSVQDKITRGPLPLIP